MKITRKYVKPDSVLLRERAMLASEAAKSRVLAKFPKARCVKEEDVPIFYIEIKKGQRIAGGFSEAASWNNADYLIRLAAKARENAGLPVSAEKPPKVKQGGK
jgi:hypothetical protein